MGDTGQGYLYQLSVTGYLASLLSKNETVDDYYILYEVDEVEPFDDIVLVVRYKESEDFRLYVIQVKSGKVILDIDKYLKGYTKIKNKKKDFLPKIGKIDEVNIQFWYFSKKLSKKFEPIDISFKEDSNTKMLEMKNSEYNNESIINENSYTLYLKNDTEVTKHQDFFNNFKIFLEQPDIEEIADKLTQTWQLSDSSQIIVYLDQFFTNIVKSKKNKIVLSKTDFELALLRMLLSNYIVTPTKVIPFNKKPADAWVNLALSHDVTIVESTPHIEACLFGCILQKVCDAITTDELNECARSEGKLSLNVKKKFASKSFKPATMRDLFILLWMTNEIPMILKAEHDLSILKKFSHLRLHYIIIDSRLQERYDEMKSYNFTVIKDLGGLQADELLQSIPVSMQGRKPTSLYEVINKDEFLLETLTCSDILKLIEPREVYLNNECFQHDSNMLFLIETTNPSLRLNQEHYNTLKYCPPNQSDVYYKELAQDPKYKGYKIYRLYSQQSEGSAEKLLLTSEYKSTKLESDQIGIITEDNTTKEHAGLEYFFVDQHGNSVYRDDENTNIPVIGEMVNFSCTKYLSRRMCKGVIQRATNRLTDDRNPIIEYTELPFWEKDFFMKTSRKICVITGKPGIGKSTSLRSLVQICYPQQYVLYCDLTLRKRDLHDKFGRSELLNNPLNFLCKTDSSLPYSNFLSRLKKDAKRLIVILDSLDEVIATCKANVLKLINELNCEPGLTKIIIGSRLLTVNLLNKEFDIDLVEIEELSNKWNGNYLQNWNLIENNLNNIPAEFLKNPLYLNFLSNIAASDINLESLNRWSLYKTVIDLKIDLNHERHYHENPDDTDRNNILKYYYGLALEVLLPYNQITGTLVENIKEKYTNVARVGIIKYFDKHGSPVFVHHTFVEFLISRWLTETSDTEAAKYVYEYISSSNNSYVLHIYSEQFSLHKAVIDRNLPQVQSLCKEYTDVLIETDKFGRTALHIAALERLVYTKNGTAIIEVIVQNSLKNNLNIYSCDKLLHWTWIDYYQRGLSENSIKLSDLYSLSAIILEAYWIFQRQIGQQSVWISMSDQQFRSLCYHALNILSINTIKNLFLFKYYKNKDLVHVDKLCSHFAITVAALPKCIIPSLKITLMHIGCIYSNINIVSACINEGDDINAKDSLGCTPLYYAVCSQEIEIVELLLQNGADMRLNPIDVASVTLFEMCLRMQNKNIMIMLIKSMDKSLQGWDSSNPLYDAVTHDHMQVVKMLLEAGVNVNVPNKFGCTLLHTVVRKTADPNLTNEEKQTSLLNEISCVDNETEYKNQYIRLLLQNGSNVNGVDKMGQTPLFTAVIHNDTETIEVLLKAGVNVNIRDVNGNTALHFAVHEDPWENISSVLVVKDMVKYGGISENIQTVKMLLNADGDVNIVNKWGNTPLHTAVLSGSTDVVQMLLQHQANACTTNFRQETALLLAVRKEQSEIIKMLLNENAKRCVNTESQSGETPLCCAIRNENVDIVNILLENGADVNYVDKNGCHMTPLFTAVERLNLEIIKILLDNDADINFKNEYDLTPLYVAVPGGNPDVISLLLAYGACPDVVPSMNTLLTRAKQRGDIDNVLAILDYWAERATWLLNAVTFPIELKEFIQSIEQKADINLMNEINLNYDGCNIELVHALLKHAAQIINQKPIGYRCLDAVLELNNKEIDQIVLYYFNKMYNEWISIETDIGFAAIREDDVMVKVLLRNRQNVDNTFLSRVIKNHRRLHPVEILLQNPIDVNLPGEKGDPPLVTAADRGTPEIVKILLEHGADVNGINSQNSIRTPLRVAVEKFKSEIVLLLLQNGAKVNSQQEPLLYLTVESPSDRLGMKIACMLLEYGADPNETDKYGRTALHWAVEMGKKHIVKKLLEFKAHVNIRDEDGLVPLSYAILMNNSAIIRMLQNAEENTDNESDCNDSESNNDDDATTLSRTPRIKDSA